MRKKKKLVLKYVGRDAFSCPIYKDQDRNIWKDISLGKSDSPDLYSVTGNDLDGEPMYPIRNEYTFSEGGPFVENPYTFEYMMLSRMQSDCNYFLGYGGRSTYALHGKTIEEHIASMKEIWNGFPEEKKPEWLSMEQILEYEMAMSSDPKQVEKGCQMLTERGVFILWRKNNYE